MIEVTEPRGLKNNFLKASNFKFDLLVRDLQNNYLTKDKNRNYWEVEHKAEPEDDVSDDDGRHQGDFPKLLVDENGDILSTIMTQFLKFPTKNLEDHTAIDETAGGDIEVEDDVPLHKEDCLVVLDEDGQQECVDSQTEQWPDRVQHPGLTGSHSLKEALSGAARSDREMPSEVRGILFYFKSYNWRDLNEGQRWLHTRYHQKPPTPWP